MNRSQQIIPLILKHEGGFVNHPSDPGGATNKGITIGTFRRFIKPKGTIADLKALTTEQAVVVYKRNYWDVVLADLLPMGVDYTVADFAVNSGPARAAKVLQKVVGATQDGQIGPATIKAVNAMPAKDVIRQVNANRLAFMKSIRGGKLWVTFGKGWQRRVDEVLAHSLRDAGQSKPETTQTPLLTLWQLILGLIKGLRK
jgi:lysozyme family protein